MLNEEPAPDHSLNTWSAQMATRMLGSVPRRMSFRRKLTERLPASTLDLQQPLLQQHSLLNEAGCLSQDIISHQRSNEITCTCKDFSIQCSCKCCILMATSALYKSFLNRKYAHCC